MHFAGSTNVKDRDFPLFSANGRRARQLGPSQSELFANLRGYKLLQLQRNIFGFCIGYGAGFPLQ